MSVSASTDQLVAALRESLKETDRLRRQNRRLLLAAREPLAIVGMSCRLPGGASSPRALWELLETGSDAISKFPSDRGWDLPGLYEPDPEAVRSGRSYVRDGGFLEDVAGFDAEFFRISPREALITDPQQRLLLEASWEAIEDAGVDPLSLRGSRTGVFAGVMYQDYGLGLQSYAGTRQGPISERQPDVLVGSTNSVVTGRVAYTLGLEGPAVTVDTACSSSLVALHLACQSLRTGECSLALAGGVTVLSTPGVFVEFSRQRGLAVDGRCKSFADSADGTSVSEGVGVVVLERLSEARRNGHPVLALLRGSAVNQDGASNGLTAPNGLSQRQVIRQALASAGLKASEVSAVEAHGTGTMLGDPIEARALIATYGRDRPEDQPLWLGSVKSNIGHAQAAAGVAGVIKMVMAMRNGLLPRTLHVDSPSTKVDWGEGEVSLLTEARSWQRNGEPRRAGVSSFGVSGTNAHLILEEAPPEGVASSAAGRSENGIDGGGSTAEQGTVVNNIPSERPGDPDTQIDGNGVAGQYDAGAVFDLDVFPWTLSGRGKEGLQRQAERLAAFGNAEPEHAVADVGVALAGRPVMDNRGVVVGSDRKELLAGVRALAEDTSRSGVLKGTVPVSGAGGVVFVFPGQGSQWAGMALELTRQSAVFARSVRECGEALSPFVDWSLEDVLLGVDGAPELERVDVVQPALFAVMVGLAELWRACGVRPDAVVGHSQGEIAAACVAGALSLSDAARLIALRSRALRALAGRGGMVSIAAGRGDVERRIEPFGDRISIAAVNGPGAVVVSGEVQGLEQLLAVCESDGVRARAIPVDYAAHSAHVREIRDALLDGCAGIVPRSCAVPFYSSVSGGPLDTTALDADYWYRNLRETVEFDRATQALLDGGLRTFIEISPHPVVTVGIQETVDAFAEEAARDSTSAIEQARSTDSQVSDVAGVSTPEPELPEVHDMENVTVLGSLRRGEGGSRRLLNSLGEAWVRGVPVDWATVLAGVKARPVKLPTYAFRRSRYWLEVPLGDGMGIVAAGQAPANYPLLGAAIKPAKGDGLLLTGRLSLSTHPWLADHAVMGMVLLPGTAFLDLALHAGSELGCGLVRDLALQAPLVLQERGGVQIQLVLDEPDEQGVRAIGIYSRPQDSPSEHSPVGEAWTCHASGTLAPDDLTGETAAPDRRMAQLAGDWPPPGAERVELDDLYERLAERGFEYGPVFQGLHGVWRRGEEVFAEVSLPEQQRRAALDFGLHPALLDATLHAIAAALLGEDESGESDGVSLPFSWNEVKLYATGAASLRAHLSMAGTDTASLAIADETGAPLASVGSLLVRPLSGKQLERMRAAERESLFCLNWVTVPLAANPTDRRWVVVGADAENLADVLCGRDPSRPEAVGSQETVEWGETHDRDSVGVAPEARGKDPGGDDIQSGHDRESAGGTERALDRDPVGYPDLNALQCAIDAGVAVPEVVLLGFAIGAPVNGRVVAPADGMCDGAAHADDLIEVAHRTVHQALAFMQGFLADERLAESKLVVLTRGAVAARVGEEVSGLAGAAVWGLLRSAQSEHPGRLTIVDLDGASDSWSALSAALAGGEPQLAMREGTAFAPRLAKASASAALTPPPGISEWRLEIGSTGTFEDLHLAPRPHANEPLRDGQVLVSVRAAGVNFRDVATALGLVSMGGDWNTIGSDGAGVVREVGPGVERFAPGDRVMGVLLGGFGPTATTDQRMLARMPANWSFTQAASVPGAFLTAYYALVDLARLKPGERLLVHAAAGGVGMAAVQLARHLGAEVFATASPGKWGVLRSMGLDDAHIGSSREPTFRDEFLKITAGQGVDVVLNSLARELVDASLELLPRGGRFIEMGKTDIRDPALIATEHAGVVYRAFDLPEAGPERIQEMLAELLDLFKRGILDVLPIRAWDVRRAVDAFRFMSQARHVGKIVLRMPAPFVEPGSSVLITGGTGQLGGLVARHLVHEHGVRNLVLASRRGEQAPGAAELEAELIEMGAQVRVTACDVGDRAQLAELIASIPDDQPLGAVVHTAGALDDGVLDSLTPERVSRVLAPKLDAAWHLHELTEHMGLQSFVLFSSAAGTLGSPGQGNYAAANTFLDALAAHRQVRGLPAISIAWGWWEQPTEMTDHLREVDLARLRSAGFEAFSSEEGLQLFDAALNAR